MSEATIPELHRPPAINTDPDDTVSPLGAHNRSESAPPGLAPLQRQSSSRRFPLASPSARQARVNIASNLFPHGAWGSLSGSQAHVQPNDTPQQPQEAQQQKQSGIHFVFNFSILIPVLFVTWDKECDTPVRSYLILLIFLNAFNASMFFFSQQYTRRYGRLSRNFLRRWGYVSTIAFLVTFTLGNAWTWASEKCDNILIGTAIFYLVTVYISIFLLLVVAVLVCCFLPHILEQLQARQPANRGATPEQIASLEEHKFERGECEEEDALCSICMDEYSPGVSLRKLPCNHHFHASCIDKWLGLKALCPLCNRKVFAAEGGEEGGDAEQQPLGDNAV